jgi:Tfp pilus assembly protein PilN
MALREINLIPDEWLNRKRAGRHLLVWASVLAVGVAGVAAGHLAYSARVLSRTRPSASVEQMNQTLRDRLAAVEAVRQELDGMLAVRRVAQAVPYSTTLWRVADTLNARTWLRELVAEGSSRSGSRLTLTGYSGSNADLGLFLNRLSTDPGFQQVRLRSSREGQVMRLSPNEDARVMEFRIECVSVP